MPTFRNYADIVAHFKKKPLTTNNVSNYAGGAFSVDHLVNILKLEALLLKDCIQEALDDYYMSYTPKRYKRREWVGHGSPLRKGLVVNTEKISNTKQGKKISVSVNFREENAMHPSLFGGKDGFVPLLLNYGWRWKKKTGPYRLAFYEGAKFVEKGIALYYQRSRRKLDLKIEVKYKGRKIVDKDFKKPE
jgi:hypothetical protein